MKEVFLIKGLAGARKLLGKIPVRGAKNAALKVMAASILFGDKLTMKNVPEIEDVNRMGDLLTDLGADVQYKNKGVLEISTTEMRNGKMSVEIAKRLRASIVLTGPLLARFGTVHFPHPGGCVIGARPIDLFLEGFKKMGAKISVSGEKGKAYYVISARGGKLRGAEIFFRNQSVTGTETFMMAAVLAEGKTVIKNAALEPEIETLAEYLNSCGAKISGAGTSTITITGTSKLKSKGRAYVTTPDRIEAGSFLVIAALLGEDVTITDCEPKHLESLIEVLTYSGVPIKVGTNTITVKVSGKKKVQLNAVDIKTHEYPGFPTDIQAPMVVYLTQTKGDSLVFETIFEGRLNYVEWLNRMGAEITMFDPHRVKISGPTPLNSKELESPDLRAGLAFVIAGIVAKGESVIHNVYNIDRGYERVEERLRAIGVSIERIPVADSVVV